MPVGSITHIPVLSSDGALTALMNCVCHRAGSTPVDQLWRSGSILATNSLMVRARGKWHERDWRGHVIHVMTHCTAVAGDIQVDRPSDQPLGQRGAANGLEDDPSSNVASDLDKRCALMFDPTANSPVISDWSA